jgi:alpha-tubulin suppressor-like RCC1 family protein
MILKIISFFAVIFMSFFSTLFSNKTRSQKYRHLKSIPLKTYSKKFVVIFTGLAVFLTGAIVAITTPDLNLVYSDTLMKKPSDKGSGEVLAPQVVSTGFLKNGVDEILNVKLPESSSKKDVNAAKKHQLLVRVDTFNAKKSGQLNIAQSNDWNVSTRDKQSPAFSYPQNDSSFTALVNVSDDNHLIAHSTSDVNVRLTALANFSDVPDVELTKNITTDGQDEQFHKYFSEDPSLATPETAKGELAPGGTKAITPFVLYDNQAGIGAKLIKSNSLSVLGKGDIPSRTEKDTYPVRAVWLTVCAGETEVRIGGSIIPAKTNKTVIAQVNQAGSVDFTVSNPASFVKITASGYVGASFYNEDQTIVDGGIAVLGSQIDSSLAQNAQSLTKIDGVEGGAFLNLADADQQNYQPNITIDDIGEITLGKQIYVEVKGTVEANAALQNVAIYAAGQFIGIANIDQTQNPARYFAKIVPGPGEANISAVATTYSGAQKVASTWAKGVDQPDSEVPIVSDDSYTLSDDAMNRIVNQSANSLTFSGPEDIVVPEFDNLGNIIYDQTTGKQQIHIIDAGDIVISNYKDKSNFSKRVVAVDKFPSKVILVTTDAALDDVFEQVNIKEYPTVMPSSGIQMDSSLKKNQKTGAYEGDKKIELSEEEYNEFQKNNKTSSSAELSSDQNEAVSKEQQLYNSTEKQPDKTAHIGEEFTESENKTNALLDASVQQMENGEKIQALDVMDVDPPDIPGDPNQQHADERGLDDSNGVNGIDIISLCVNVGFDITAKVTSDTGAVNQVAVNAKAQLRACFKFNVIIEVGFKIFWKWNFIPFRFSVHFKLGMYEQTSARVYLKGALNIQKNLEEFPLMRFDDVFVAMMAAVPLWFEILFTTSYSPGLVFEGMGTGSIYVSQSYTNYYEYNTGADDNGVHKHTKNGSKTANVYGQFGAYFDAYFPMGMDLGLWGTLKLELAILPFFRLGFQFMLSNYPEADNLCSIYGPPCGRLNVSLNFVFQVYIAAYVRFKVGWSLVGPLKLQITFKFAEISFGPVGLNISVFSMVKETPPNPWIDMFYDPNVPMPGPEPGPSPPNPAYTGPGSVYSYGDNQFGQLGNGEIGSSTYDLEPALGLSNIKKIVSSPSSNATYALDDKGYLYSWGDNSKGQLGRGFIGDKPSNWTSSSKAASEPDKVVNKNGNPLTGVQDIAAFDGGGYALNNQGLVYSWGDNSLGQLGDSSSNSRTYADQIPTLEAVSTISSGSATGYSVKEDGTLWAYGKDITKASGSWTTPTRLGSISKANGQDISLMAAGSDNFYFVLNNIIYGIGANNGVTFGANKPDYITADNYAAVENQPSSSQTNGWYSLSANGQTAYALGNDSAVYAWGKNENGQIGNGEKSSGYVGFTKWQSTERAASISAGNGFVVASTEKGNMLGWGKNDSGQLGLGKNISQISSPTFNSTSHISQVAAGGKNSYIVRKIATTTSTSGTLNQVIYNSQGESTILPVQGIAQNTASKTVTNSMGTFVLTKKGGVKKITNNSLTSEDINNSNNEINKVEDIAASDDAVFAMTEDGSIFSWADSVNSKTLGRLVSKTQEAQTPTRVKLDDWVDNKGQIVKERCGKTDESGVTGISAFGYRVFAICQINGLGSVDNPAHLIAWGENTDDALGIVDNAAWALEPQRVKAIDVSGVDFEPSAISAGANFTSVLNKDGSVLAFGPTSAADYINAVNAAYFTWGGTVADSKNITSITASRGGFYFVNVLGEIWTSGQSVNDGENANQNIKEPVKVKNLDSSFIISVAALKTKDNNLNDTIFAQTDDSEIMAFGNDLANPAGSMKPNNFNSIFNSVSVWAQDAKAYIITGDYNNPAAPGEAGYLFSAGQNSSGQLGLNSIISQSNLELAETVDSGQIVQAAANNSAGYALTPDGKIMSFGDNSLGQRGVGDVSQAHNTSTFVIGLQNIVQISAADDAAFALDKNGNVWAWGRLADGSYLIPQKLQSVNNIIQISSASGSLYMIRSNGSVLLWNLDFHKSANNLEQLNHITKISASQNSVLALQTPNSGAAANSSDNSVNNVLLYNKNTGITQKIVLPKGPDGKDINVENIAASINGGNGGDASTYYISDSKGLLYAWGSNSAGQANPYSDESSFSAPQRVVFPMNGSSIKSLAAGWKDIYLTDELGEVWAFGDNSFGQLAQGNTDTIRNVVTISGYLAKEVFAGKGVLFVTGETAKDNFKAGAIYAMGDNTNGSLGVDSKTAKISQFTSLNPADNQAGGTTGTNFVKVATNGSTTIALDESKNVWQWGKDFDSLSTSNQPVLLQGIKNVSDIAIGAQTAYALKTDKTVWAWGVNNLGQLGNNKLDIKSLSKMSPQIVWGLFNIVKIGAGSDFAMAQKSDGTVYSWGNNDYYQLGLGQYKKDLFYGSPQIIEELQGIAIKQLTGGAKTGYALTTSGEVWSWGRGDQGQRGDGVVDSKKAVPAKIDITPGIQNPNQVFAYNIGASDDSAFIMGSDGLVYAWGKNDKNQLGTVDGTKPVPNPYLSASQDTLVSGKTSYLATGKNSVYFIDDDGQTVAGFGGNDAGQFGGSAQSYATKQKLIKSYTGSPLSLFAGGNQIYIIVPIDVPIGSDTNIWAVGNNDSGQLGQGSSAAKSSQKILSVRAVSEAQGVTAASVAAVDQTAAAALQDGRVLTWGSAANGLLGNNSESGNRTLADFVMAPAGGQQYLVTNSAVCSHALCEIQNIISAGTAFYALTQSGAIYAWGNYQGGNKLEPTLVLAPESGVDKITDIISEGSRLVAWHNKAFDNSSNGVVNSLWAWTNDTAPAKINISNNNKDNIEKVFVTSDAYYAVVTLASDDRTIYAWGSNANCALADTVSCTLESGHTENVPFIPKMLARTPLVNKVKDFTVKGNQNLALDQEGHIWKWWKAAGNMDPTISQDITLSGSDFVNTGSSQFVYTKCLTGMSNCSASQVYAEGRNNYGQLGTNSVSDVESWVQASQFSTKLSATSLASGSSGFTLAIGVTPEAPTISNTTATYKYNAGDKMALNFGVQGSPLPDTNNLSFKFSEGWSSLDDLGLKAQCDTSDCSVSGTLQGAPGIYAFIVTISTYLGSVSQQYQIVLDGLAPTLEIKSQDIPTSLNIGDEVSIPVYTKGLPKADVSGQDLPEGLLISEISDQADLDAGITHRIEGKISSTAKSLYNSSIKATNAVLPDGVSQNITFNISQTPAFHIPCEDQKEGSNTKCIIKISTQDIVNIDLNLVSNPEITDVSVSPASTLQTLGINLERKPVVDSGNGTDANVSEHWFLTTKGIIGSHKGQYELTAKAGENVSKTFWLYVDDILPSISSSTNYSQIIGNQIYFPLTIEGIPFPTLSPAGYSKNGVKSPDNAWPNWLHLDLNNDGQSTAQNINSLIIALTSPALTKDEIGDYIINIMAKNVAGSVNLAVSLHITGAEPVINITDQQFFFDNSKLSRPVFDFSVTGSPDPYVVLEDAKFTSDDGVLTDVPSTLFILDNGPLGVGPFSLFTNRNLISSDVGQYTLNLKAKNAMGEVTKQVKISIAEKASFNITGKTEYNLGDEAVLNLGLSGNPCPSSVTAVLPDGADFTSTIEGTSCVQGYTFKTSQFKKQGSYQIKFSAIQKDKKTAIQSEITAYATINVNPSQPQIKIPTSITVYSGTSFEQSLQISGNPCPAFVSLQNAPEWVQIAKTDSDSWCDGGKIYGTPPSDALINSTFPITIEAKVDDTNKVQTSSTIEIVGTPPSFHINDSTNGTVGKYFSLDLGVTGNPFPNVSVQNSADGQGGVLPAGLSLYKDQAKQKWFIQGVPEKAGLSEFSLVATNSANASQTGKNLSESVLLSIIISGSFPAFNPVGTTNIFAGQSINMPLGVTGSPCPVVEIDSASPRINGVDITGNCNEGFYLKGIVDLNTLPGVYDTKITAVNPQGKAVTILPLEVFAVSSPPTITDQTTYSILQTRLSSINLGVQGSPCPEVSVDDVNKLPKGMYLVPNLACTDPYGARIEGVPLVEGSYTFKVKASNSSGVTEKDITINVKAYTQAPQFYSPVSAIGSEQDFFIFNLGLTSDPISHIYLDSQSDKLPSGLELLANSDGSYYISGRPDLNTAGIYNLIIMADNGIEPKAKHLLTLTITKDSITPAFHLPTNVFTQTLEDNFEIPLLVSGSPCPVLSYQITSPSSNSSVSDLSISGTCDSGGFILHGKAVSLGQTTVRLTAQNPEDASQQAIEDINIVVGSVDPQIVAPSYISAKSNESISVPIIVIGEPVPVLTAKDLPDGLILVGSDRNWRIQGSITKNGLYRTVLTAQNANSSKQMFMAFSILNSSIQFNMPDSDNAAYGVYYNIPLDITGTCPESVKITEGSLPDGLNIVGGCTGSPYAISGVPQFNSAKSSDTFAITLQAELNSGGPTAVKTFTLNMRSEAPQFFSSDTAVFKAGDFGVFDLDVIGNPIPVVTIEEGVLPDGLKLQVIDQITGDVGILGTPSHNSLGTKAVKLKAQNPQNPAIYTEKVLNIKIVGDAPAFAISSNIAVGVDNEFVYSLGVSGNPCPQALQYNKADLPQGVSILGTNCSSDPYRIAGLVSKVGTWVIPIKASNSEGAAELDLTLHSASSAPQIGGPDNVQATEKQFFAADLAVGGDPCPSLTFSASQYSGNINLVQASDLSCNFRLTGVIDNSGEYQVNIVATNSAGSAHKQIILHIGGTKPAFHLDSNITVPEESTLKIPLNITGDPAPTAVLESINLIDPASGPPLPQGLSVKKQDNSWFLVGSLEDSLIDGYDKVTYGVNMKASNSDDQTGVTTFELLLTVAKQQPKFVVPNTVYTTQNSYYELPLGLDKYSVRIKEGSALPEGLILALPQTPVKSHLGWLLYGTPIAVGVTNTTLELVSGTEVLDTANIEFNVVYSAVPQFNPTGKTSVLNSEKINISLGVVGNPAPTVSVQGSLPAGLKLLGSVGSSWSLQGKIEQAGKYPILLRACSGAGDSAICTDQSITIAVTDGSPQFNVANQILLTVGVEKIIDLQVSGNPNPAVSIESGNLPKGLATDFDQTTGLYLIKGTPEEIGENTVTLKAENGSNPARVTITFTTGSQAPVFFLPATASAVISEYFSLPIAISGNPCPVLTLDESSEALPGGLTLQGSCDSSTSSSYKIAGTVTDLDHLGNYNIVLSAKNSDTKVLGTININVVSRAPVFSVGTKAEAVFVKGKFSRFDLGVTGSPYPDVTLESGNLPAGLSLETDALTKKSYILGSPDSSVTIGSQTVVNLKAQNPDNPSQFAQLQLTLTINDDSPHISLQSSNQGPIVTVGYNEEAIINFNLAGSPLPTVNLSGALPSGFALTGSGTSTVSIAGQSTKAGTYQVALTAENIYGSQTYNLILVILGAQPRFLSNPVIDLTVDALTSYDLGVTSCPYGVQVVLKNPEDYPLPDGLELKRIKDDAASNICGNVDNSSASVSPSDKWVIQGTPKVLGEKTITLEACAVNSQGQPVGVLCERTEFEINIRSSAPKFNVVTDSDGKLILPLTSGAEVNFDLNITGNPIAEVSVSQGALPNGLTISDGFIKGVLNSDIGQYSLELIAKNNSGKNDKLPVLISVSGQNPAFHPLSTKMHGTIGQVFDLDLGVTGKPLPFVFVESGHLPPGISLVQSDSAWYLRGRLQGDPGLFDFTLKAQTPVSSSVFQENKSEPIIQANTVSSAQDEFLIQADAIAPSFNISSGKTLSVKQFKYVNLPLHYSAQPCKTPSVSNLPLGLSLSGSCSDGYRINGTVLAAPGSHTIRLAGENAAGKAQKDLRLNILQSDKPNEFSPSSNDSSGAVLANGNVAKEPQSVKPKSDLPENSNILPDNQNIPDEMNSSFFTAQNFLVFFGLLLLLLALAYFVIRRFSSRKLLFAKKNKGEDDE